VLGLFTRDLEYSFFSFRREGLHLEGLYLRERKFNLRERLDVKALGGRLGGLGGELITDLRRRVIRALK